MKSEKKPQPETHESFGLVQLLRPTGRFENLFQSGIQTGHAMTMTVSRAAIYQRPGEDWDDGDDHLMAEESIVEFTLSPLQFAELITAAGSGQGVPCTLEYVNGRRQLGPPKREQATRRAVGQFAAECEDLAAFSKTAGALVAEILAKGAKMKAADRKKLQEIFGKLTGVASSTGPFLMGRAEDHLRRLTAEARATISDHAFRVAASSGTKASAVTIPATGQLDRPNSEPPPPAPEIPELPDLEIASKKLEELDARDLGILINRHLKRIEGKVMKRKAAYWMKHRVHEKAVPGEFYQSGAWDDRGKVLVRYVSYQGTTSLTIEQARAYLSHLWAGVEKGHFHLEGCGRG